MAWEDRLILIIQRDKICEMLISQIPNGLYLIKWLPEHGGGYSVAAIGQNHDGRRWFAPTNWLRVPAFDWETIESVKLLSTQRSEIEKADL